MKFFLFFLLTLTFLSAENKVALIIGNQNYKNYPKLTTPINDTMAVAKLLENKGFDTIILQNTTEREVWDKLNDFGLKASKADIALFYFAGHGITIDNKNYLIPMDAPMVTNEVSRYNFIPLDEITDIASRAKSSIVLVDASRDIYLPRKFQKGLAPIKPKRNSIVAFSAPIYTTTSRKYKSHSFFGQALLENFNKDREIGLILYMVQRDIMRKNKFEQYSYLESRLGFDKIYLEVPETNNYMESLPHNSFNIKKHVYTLVSSIDDIQKLQNMKTYVLFPDDLSFSAYKNSRKHERYKRVLALIQEVQKYTLGELILDINLSKSMNQFILFGKKEDEKKLTLNDYDYKLAHQVMDYLIKSNLAKYKYLSHMEEQKYLMEKSREFWGEGPFLITTTDNIVEKKVLTYLYIDLSEFDNSAINEIINSYKERLIDKGNSKFTVLEKLRHRILSLITNANYNVHVVKSVIAGDLN